MMLENMPPKPDYSNFTTTETGHVVKKETVEISKQEHSELVRKQVLCDALLEGFASMKNDTDPQVRDFAQKANTVILATQRVINAMLEAGGM